MATVREDVARLPLPQGLRASSMVGRGGHNVKWLHHQSGGAHITVNDTGIVVRSKNCHARARAVRLIKRQLQALSLLDVTPQGADLVALAWSLGADPWIRFSEMQDSEMAPTSLGHKSKLFRLTFVSSQHLHSSRSARGTDQKSAVYPCNHHLDAYVELEDAYVERDQQATTRRRVPAGTTGSCEAAREGTHIARLLPDTVDVLGADSSKDGGDRDSTPRLHGASSAGRSTTHGASQTFNTDTNNDCAVRHRAGMLVAAVRGLDGAVHAAACQPQRYGTLKLKFKLGKAVFRNVGPLASATAVQLSALQVLSSGRGGLQCTWSNDVPPTTVPWVTCWLQDHLGFKLMASKTSASFHVINQELNMHYTVALRLPDGHDSSACLHKIKAGDSRRHTVSLLTDPDQVDLRLKLVANNSAQLTAVYDTDAVDNAQRVVAAVQSEGFQGFIRSRQGLTRHRQVEYGRRMSKCLYEGLYRAPGNGGCGHRVRVCVAQVEDDCGVHWEVTGCLPELDERLAQLLYWWRPQQQPWPSGDDHVGGQCGAAEGVAATALTTLAAFIAQLNAHLGAASAAHGALE